MLFFAYCHLPGYWQYGSWQGLYYIPHDQHQNEERQLNLYSFTRRFTFIILIIKVCRGSNHYDGDLRCHQISPRLFILISKNKSIYGVDQRYDKYKLSVCFGRTIEIEGRICKRQ
ncbi:hypothetical protein NQ317_005436 [Molorchus minor]|uniref:Uncharacterized protein n=1 Tax=Molorchus minor TaxID=1323400 RepID=A0ABQ9JHM2_9CUCU|nr:hypothetical protein NQ317_005436 [Molorchus minor]